MPTAPHGKRFAAGQPSLVDGTTWRSVSVASPTDARLIWLQRNRGLPGFWFRFAYHVLRGISKSKPMTSPLKIRQCSALDPSQRSVICILLEDAMLDDAHLWFAIKARRSRRRRVSGTRARNPLRAGHSDGDDAPSLALGDLRDGVAAAFIEHIEAALARQRSKGYGAKRVTVGMPIILLVGSCRGSLALSRPATAPARSSG